MLVVLYNCCFTNPFYSSSTDISLRPGGAGQGPRLNGSFSEPAYCLDNPPPCALSRYRTMDGTCNNLEYPLRYGVSKTPFRRVLPADYGDGEYWSIIVAVLDKKRYRYERYLQLLNICLPWNSRLVHYDFESSIDAIGLKHYLRNSGYTHLCRSPMIFPLVYVMLCFTIQKSVTEPHKLLKYVWFLVQGSYFIQCFSFAIIICCA